MCVYVSECVRMCLSVCCIRACVVCVYLECLVGFLYVCIWCGVSGVSVVCVGGVWCVSESVWYVCVCLGACPVCFRMCVVCVWCMYV